MKPIILFSFLLISALLTASTVVADELNCPLCEYMVKKIVVMLEGKANETFIIDTLDNDCKGLVSKTFVESCVTIVNDYTPLIIEHLENKEDPKTICHSIGACNSTAMSPLMEQAGQLITKIEKLATLDCPLCKYMVEKVETLLKDNSNETAIIDSLDNDCKVLVSPTFVESCVAIVNDYTPLMIDMLQKKETPTAICQKLSACSNSSLMQRAGQFIATLV